MTREERLYDSELYGGRQDLPSPAPARCPECGAFLDADDDLLYVTGEADYVLGCARCVRALPPREGGFDE